MLIKAYKAYTNTSNAYAEKDCFRYLAELQMLQKNADKKNKKLIDEFQKLNNDTYSKIQLYRVQCLAALLTSTITNSAPELNKALDYCVAYTSAVVDFAIDFGIKGIVGQFIRKHIINLFKVLNVLYKEAQPGKTAGQA